MANNLPEDFKLTLKKLTNKGFERAVNEQRGSLHKDLRHLIEEAERDDDRVYIDEGDDRGHTPGLRRQGTADRQGYMTTLPKTREKLATDAEVMNKNLDRLSHGESAENVLGKGWKSAFVSAEDIESGNVVLHCGCMDERVPDTDGGLKVGTAGSGILMTDFDAPAFDTNDVEAIYAFLSDPASGNANFKALVASLKAKQAKGTKIIVSDHGGCGAAGMFCARFDGKNLDPAKAAKAAANRLHKALGLEGDAKHTDYGKADIPMNRDPHLHDAHCLIIDGTGRFRADAVPTTLRGLKLSGINYLTDPENEEQNGYLRTELNAGSGIIAGSHGVGLKDAPIVVILDPKNPASRTTIEKRYNLAQYAGRKIHFITAPENA